MKIKRTKNLASDDATMALLTVENDPLNGAAQQGLQQQGVRQARVNLLPKEYYNELKERKILRLLGLIVAGVFLVGIAGSVAAAMIAQDAKNALAAEQQRGAELREEKAKYSDLTVLLSEIETAKAAQTVALYAETDWNKVSAEFERALEGTDSEILALNLGQRLAPRVGNGGFTDTSDANPLSELTPVFIEYQVESKNANAGDKILDKLVTKITGYEWAIQTSVKKGNDGKYVFSGVIRVGLPSIGSKRAAAIDEDTLQRLRESFEQASRDRNSTPRGA